MDETKLPWNIDLLNITLGNHDLDEAKRRIRLLSDTFREGRNAPDSEPRFLAY